MSVCSTSHSSRLTVWLYCLVFIGGGLGALLRYSLSLSLACWRIKSLTLATFAANIIACFLYAVLSAWCTRLLAYRKRANSDGKLCNSISQSVQYVQTGVTTGFCGGLSTMSTFAFEGVVSMLPRGLFCNRARLASLPLQLVGHMFPTLVYMLVCVCAGIGVAYVGARLGASAVWSRV